MEYATILWHLELLEWAVQYSLHTECFVVEKESKWRSVHLYAAREEYGMILSIVRDYS